MKKSIFILLMATLLVWVDVALADKCGVISTRKVMIGGEHAATITKNTNESSEAIDLATIACKGTFSIQYVITGDGTVTIEYLLSNHDQASPDFIEPSTASDIGTGLTKTSGPGSDGKDIISFEPEPGRWMKIKVTETGTANDAVVQLDLFIQ